MYRVSVIRPNGLVVRTIYIDSPLTSKQEESLLEKFPECWLDISREESLLESHPEYWEDEDYYDCFEPQYGQIFSNGKFFPDYRKAE